jgi:acyl carrier protein
MLTNYYLNSDELDLNILESIKNQFKNKNIRITVETQDDTDYILSSPKMVERLLEANKNKDGLSLDEVYEKLGN